MSLYQQGHGKARIFYVLQVKKNITIYILHFTYSTEAIQRTAEYHRVCLLMLLNRKLVHYCIQKYLINNHN